MFHVEKKINITKLIENLNFPAKLPKWFGERPGKKAGEPETPDGEEDAKVEIDDEEVEEEEAPVS